MADQYDHDGTIPGSDASCQESEPKRQCLRPQPDRRQQELNENALRNMFICKLCLLDEELLTGNTTRTVEHLEVYQYLHEKEHVGQQELKYPRDGIYYVGSDRHARVAYNLAEMEEVD